MTYKEVIAQLEDLIANSESFIVPTDSDEDNKIWLDDIVALNIAIDVIKEKMESES